MADRFRPFAPLAQSWPIPSHRTRNCGPITPPLGEEGSPIRAGAAVVQGRHLPKINEIPETVWPQSTRLPKLGPRGHFRAHNSPYGGRSGPNFVGMFHLSRGMLLPNLIAIDQSWTYLPIEPTIFGSITPPLGMRGPSLGSGLLLFREVNPKTERDPPNRLSAIRTLCQNWAQGAP